MPELPTYKIPKQETELLQAAHTIAKLVLESLDLDAAASAATPRLGGMVDRELVKRLWGVAVRKGILQSRPPLDCAAEVDLRGMIRRYNDSLIHLPYVEVVLTGQGEVDIADVATRAADYVDGLIKRLIQARQKKTDCVVRIGIGPGRCVGATVETLVRLGKFFSLPDQQYVEIASLCSHWNTNSIETQPNFNVGRLCFKFNNYRVRTLPADQYILPEHYHTLMERKSVQAMLGIRKEPFDILLVGTGPFDSPASCLQGLPGLIDTDRGSGSTVVQSLFEAGCIADILLIPLTADGGVATKAGTPSEHILNSALSLFPHDQLREAVTGEEGCHVVCIASGGDKGGSIAACIRGGLINSLLTDISNATRATEILRKSLPNG